MIYKLVEFPQKTEIRSNIRTQLILLLGIYLMKMKTVIQKDTCTLVFISVIYSGKDREAT